MIFMTDIYYLSGIRSSDSSINSLYINIITEVIDRNILNIFPNFLKGYSIDTICRCAFGIETNAYEDSEHQLIKQGRAIIQGFQVTNWMDTIGFLLFYLFPGLEAVS